MNVSAIWQNPNNKQFYYKERPFSKWIKLNKSLTFLFERHLKKEIVQLLRENNFKNSDIKNVEEDWKDIFNKPLVKVNFENNISYYRYNNFLKKLKEKGIGIYGRDIINIFPYDISERIEDKRIWFLDIEVEGDEDITEDTVPSSILAKGMIISITYYDSYEKEYYSIIVSREKVDTFNKKIRFVDSEEELLKTFNNLLKRKVPDIITGWYSNGYDIPYIINRGKKYHIIISAIDGLKPYSSYKKQPSGYRFNNSIPGVNLLDYMELYKKYIFEKPPSYKLDEIARIHNIEGKSEYMGFLNYKKNFEKFVEYIFRDVEILVELEDKLNLLNLICGLQSVIRIPINMLLAPSISIEHYLQQFLLPEKKSFKENYNIYSSKNVDFEGAIVLQPPDKKYENVIVLDYASLYPNAIQTFNLSPETLRYDFNYNGKHVDIGLMIQDEGKDYIPLKYTLEIEGVLPSLIRYLLKERLKFKQLKKSTPPDNPEYIKYDIKQSNYKILLNSMYGVIGTERFPLHDKRVAASITGGARGALRYMNNKLNNHEFKDVDINGKKISFRTEVIYSDTDSSFNVIHCDEELSKKDVVQIGKYIATYINDNIAKEFVVKYSNTEEIINRNSLKVEVDKIFKVVRFFGVKKRYFGYDFDKNIITHGVEIVRVDTPRKIKDILKDLFIRALDGVLKKEDLIRYYNVIKQTSLEEIAISKTVTKIDFDKYKTIPNHVRAIQLMKEIYKFKYTLNDKLLYFHIKYNNRRNYRIVERIFNKKFKDVALVSACIEREHLPQFVKLIKANEFEIDYYTFFDKQVLSTLKQFSEYREIIKEVKSEIEKLEGINNKSEQLKLF
ncbi:DNA polymerase domain-containing protein [Marinitoga sp. 1138]|uniref:DNA polymerase domain-containing protein n=1 Tax=Marinitoga sp. 1138 TaxID=1643334 RepID=UPI0015861CA8|nr:DNA polymerase domain-containing protein [Marinitoga sp. 1138]NUU97813.1 hypothetical protein [Marinitoga sp. 1138]